MSDNEPSKGPPESAGFDHEAGVGRAVAPVTGAIAASVGHAGREQAAADVFGNRCKERQ